jgi:hypothetical protein
MLDGGGHGGWDVLDWQLISIYQYIYILGGEDESALVENIAKKNRSRFPIAVFLSTLIYSL